MGGSIAIGHPFGATGARILTTLVHELARRDGQFGLLTVCAAGGLGYAMVVERDHDARTLSSRSAIESRGRDVRPSRRER